MARTALDITDEDMAVYRAKARRLQAEEQQRLLERAQHAYDIAQKAAQLLKDQFGAKRVVLFGSLARNDVFHQRSDIDLAVTSIEEGLFWRAWSALDTLESKVEIDLVDLETAPPKLQQRIEQEGVEL